MHPKQVVIELLNKTTQKTDKKTTQKTTQKIIRKTTQKNIEKTTQKSIEKTTQKILFFYLKIQILQGKNWQN